MSKTSISVKTQQLALIFISSLLETLNVDEFNWRGPRSHDDWCPDEDCPAAGMTIPATYEALMVGETMGDEAALALYSHAVYDPETGTVTTEFATEPVEFVPVDPEPEQVTTTLRLVD